MDIEFVNSLSADINEYLSKIPEETHQSKGDGGPVLAEGAEPRFIKGRGGIGSERIVKKRAAETEETALAKRLKYDRRRKVRLAPLAAAAHFTFVLQEEKDESEEGPLPPRSNEEGDESSEDEEERYAVFPATFHVRHCINQWHMGTVELLHFPSDQSRRSQPLWLR